MIPFEIALVSSYRLPIVTFLYLYAFQRYCRFCAPAYHFFPPTSRLVSPKFHHVPLVVGGWPFGVGLIIVGAISFQDVQPMWSRSTNVTQTDRQTTCNHNTALCTTMHRAVKTIILWPETRVFDPQPIVCSHFPLSRPTFRPIVQFHCFRRRLEQ